MRGCDEFSLEIRRKPNSAGTVFRWKGGGHVRRKRTSRFSFRLQNKESRRTVERENGVNLASIPTAEAAMMSRRRHRQQQQEIFIQTFVVCTRPSEREREKKNIKSAVCCVIKAETDPPEATHWGEREKKGKIAKRKNTS